MRSTRQQIAALALAFVWVPLAAAQAGEQAAQPGRIAWQPPGPTSLQRPHRIRVAAAKLDPVWTADGLFALPPTGLRGLALALHAGPAVFDPSAHAWFASAMGAIVRVEADGSLPVVAPSVQGLDVDVRAAAGVAVSREPDDTIVLHRFGKAGSGKTVLVRGGAFFEPRFSPDGSTVLLAESQPAGGHFWVVDTAGQARDLGQGYGAVWHPDGKRILFMRIEHDGARVTASELWLHDLGTGRQTRLTATPDTAEIEPAVSADGRWLAYADAHTGELCIAAFPKTDRR
jgi:hypothetical protein